MGSCNSSLGVNASHFDVIAKNSFTIDSAFIERNRARGDWLESGLVILPGEADIVRMDVSASPSQAAEIKSLDLNLNAITTVVGSERLGGLKELFCNGFQLETVPSWVASLPALEEIWLDKNNLREIPAWLMDMPTLKKIHAFENRKLRSIPTGKKVTYLDVSHCDIQSLPHDFFHYELETVKINGNSGESFFLVFVCLFVCVCVFARACV